MEDKKYIVALEIGSSHIAGVVASVTAQADASIVCYHEVPIVDCVRYGSIFNVDEVCTKTKELLRRITADRHVSPFRIDSVYLTFGGRSLHSERVAIDRDINETIPVSQDFIDTLKREAASKFDSKNVVEVLPSKYELDGAVVNPIGAIGSHLHAEMNVVLCRPQMRHNLQMVFDRLQIRVNGYITTPVAAAQSLLSSEERRLGCMYVDHGAETTTVAIYKDNGLRYLNVLPMGSRNITRDLCSLSLLDEQAEKVKINYGDAMATTASLPAAEIAGINAADIANYVFTRTGEMVENVYYQLQIADIPADDLKAGIVATGRGMRLKGMAERLADATKMKVRIAQFPGIDSSSELSKIPQLLSVVEWISSQPTVANCMSVPPMPENDDPNPPVEEPVKEAAKIKDGTDKPQKPKKPGIFGKFWKAIGDTMSGDGMDDEM